MSQSKLLARLLFAEILKHLLGPCLLMGQTEDEETWQVCQAGPMGHQGQGRIEILLLDTGGS